LNTSPNNFSDLISFSGSLPSGHDAEKPAVEKNDRVKSKSIFFIVVFFNYEFILLLKSIKNIVIDLKF